MLSVANIKVAKDFKIELLYTVPRAGYMVKQSDELSLRRSPAHDGGNLEALAP